MVVVLLLLMSGDIEMNPGPVGECINMKYRECIASFLDFLTTRRQRNIVHFLICYGSLKPPRVEHDARELENHMLS